MSMKIALAGFAALGFGLTCVPVHGSPIDLTASADTFVRGGSSSSDNYGASGQLQLKQTDSEAGQRKSWVRFDLSSVTDEIASATLRFTIDAQGAGNDPDNHTWHFDVFGLLDGNAGESWVQGDGTSSNPSTATGPTPPNAITWDNAPGNGSPVDPASTTGPLGAFTIVGEGVRGDIVSITGGAGSALIDFLNDDTDGEVTFIINRRESDTDFTGTPNVVHALVSTEGATDTLAPPTLSLTVPEPGSLMLMGLGGLTLLSRKRRSNSQ